MRSRPEFMAHLTIGRLKNWIFELHVNLLPPWSKLSTSCCHLTLRPTWTRGKQRTLINHRSRAPVAANVSLQHHGAIAWRRVLLDKAGLRTEGCMLKWIRLFFSLLVGSQAAVADDGAKLVGIWKLISCETQFQDGRDSRPCFGRNPAGYIIMTPQARMMAVLEGEGRKPGKTDEELAPCSVPCLPILECIAWKATSGSPRSTFPGIRPGMALSKCVSTSSRVIGFR